MKKILLIVLFTFLGYQLIESDMPSAGTYGKIVDENLIIRESTNPNKIAKILRNGYRIIELDKPTPGAYQQVTFSEYDTTTYPDKIVEKWALSDTHTLEEAKTAKRGALKTEAAEHFEKTYSYFDVVLYAIDESMSHTAIKTDYNAVKNHFIAKRAEVDACDTLQCVGDVTADWPEL